MLKRPGNNCTCACLAILSSLLLGACTTSSAKHEWAVDTATNRSLIPSGTPDSNRAVFAGCKAEVEMDKYAEFLGEEVLITLMWVDMPSESANLKAPAVVHTVEDDRLAVNFSGNIPNLAFYTSIWQASGHISARKDGSYDVDPCSAVITKGNWQVRG